MDNVSGNRQTLTDILVICVEELSIYMVFDLVIKFLNIYGQDDGHSHAYKKFK